MEKYHYRVSHINPNTFVVEFYDTLTKKSSSQLASKLNADDIVDLFSESDQRLIAFNAGREDSLFGKVKKNIKLSALEEKKYVFLMRDLQSLFI